MSNLIEVAAVGREFHRRIKASLNTSNLDAAARAACDRFLYQADRLLTVADDPGLDGLERVFALGAALGAVEAAEDILVGGHA